MSSFDDSSDLAQDQRLRETARLLATGILRLHRRRLLPTEDFSNSSPEGLEVSSDSRLSVHNGLQLETS